MSSKEDASIWAAIGLACLAGLFFVCLNATVKYLTTDYDTVMLVWGRYFFHVLFVVIFFPRVALGMFRTPQLKVQTLRSILLLISTITNFAALAFMPMGDVAAIIFTSPLLVAGLAMLLLREKVEVARWFAIAAGFSGTLLIVRPGSTEFNIGALLALFCALAYALYQVSTRMVREAEPIVSLLFGGIVGVIVFSAVVPFYWQTPTLIDLSLMAMTGLFGAVGHLMMIMALQRAEASRVSPFTYLQLVWAMLLSIFLFGDVPDQWTIIGASVIMASGLALLIIDRRAMRQKVRHDAA